MAWLKVGSGYLLVGLLLCAGAGLLSGLFAGLVRLGWSIEGGSPISPVAHGPLMINGFLGTLIGLERAAALDKKWAYFAPLLLAASTILLLAGNVTHGKHLLVAGSFFLFMVLVYLYHLRPVTYHLVMALGGASLLAGNILFQYGFPIYNLVAWWAGFPLLTIFGERLELNRIMRPPVKAQRLFSVLVILWIIGVGFTYVDRYTGWAIASIVLIAQALWLFKYDVARKTIKASAWTRYSAICLLSGYVWLVMAGLLGLTHGFPASGPLYDALLHMIFIGFVFSMIFAHAAVIIPSLSGRMVPYSRYFYLPLVLLHGFLLLRVAGDMAWIPEWRTAGSYGNVLAILLFLGGIIVQLSGFSPNRTAITPKRSENR